HTAVIDAAALRPAQQAAGLPAGAAEEGQQQGRHDQEARQGKAAAVGQLPPGLLGDQRAENAPAHHVSLPSSSPLTPDRRLRLRSGCKAVGQAFQPDIFVEPVRLESLTYGVLKPRLRRLRGIRWSGLEFRL